ncbi:MAG: hypothetical protein ACPGD5_05530 [Salibacteraceae bacterium]
MKIIKIVAWVVLLVGLFVTLVLPDSSQSAETNKNLTDTGFYLIIIPSFLFILEAIFRNKKVIE